MRLIALINTVNYTVRMQKCIHACSTNEISFIFLLVVIIAGSKILRYNGSIPADISAHAIK